MLVISARTGLATLVIDLPDIVVFVPDNSTPAMGDFEVLLTLTGTDAITPPPVGGYTLNFLATGSGLTFTTLASTTTATPLFPAPLDPSSSLMATGDPGWRVNANDDVDTDISAFNNAGLAKISYTIAAGNVGTTYPMTFDATGMALTALATAAGGEYSLTLIDGSITVVPEPSAFLVMGAAALLATGCAYCWKKLARTSASC
jgi:hypothetical protein